MINRLIIGCKRVYQKFYEILFISASAIALNNI